MSPNYSDHSATQVFNRVHTRKAFSCTWRSASILCPRGYGFQICSSLHKITALDTCICGVRVNAIGEILSLVHSRQVSCFLSSLSSLVVPED